MNKSLNFQKKEFQKIIKATNIREVFMTSAYCECRIHYQLIEPEHTMLNITQKDIDTDFIIGDDKKRGTILSKIHFTLEGLPKRDIKTNNKVIKTKDEALFTISVSYAVTYDVNNINLNKEAVKYFGIENAYFNVYPYLREFITHISQRLHLSPVVIPLLKPTSKQ